MNLQPSMTTCFTALVLLFAPACEELPGLDDPRESEDVEGLDSCNPEGTWSLTISNDEGDCFVAGSYTDTLTFSPAPDGNNRFKAAYGGDDGREPDEVVFHSSGCYITMKQTLEAELTETTYGVRRIFEEHISFDEDTATGYMDFEESIWGHDNPDDCSQRITLEGMR